MASSNSAEKSFELGDWVIVQHAQHPNHTEGVILFIGDVDGLSGTQYGIEVTDFSVGEHNGTYEGTAYFEVRYITDIYTF